MNYKEIIEEALFHLNSAKITVEQSNPAFSELCSSIEILTNITKEIENSDTQNVKRTENDEYEKRKAYYCDLNFSIDGLDEVLAWAEEEIIKDGITNEEIIEKIKYTYQSFIIEDIRKDITLLKSSIKRWRIEYDLMEFPD